MRWQGQAEMLLLWVPAEMGSMRQPLDLAVLWWRARVEMLLPSELAEVGSMLLP